MPLTPIIPSAFEAATLCRGTRNLDKIDFSAVKPKDSPARKPSGNGHLPAEREKMPLDAMPGASGSTIRR